MLKDYFFVAVQPVPALIAAIAFLTSNLESASILTSLVLLLASNDLMPSTFDKARFTFLTQPPQVIFLTSSVTVESAAITVGTSLAVTLLTNINAIARTMDLSIILFSLFLVYVRSSNLHPCFEEINRIVINN